MSDTPKFGYCWVENDELPDMVCTLVDQDLSLFTVTLHLRRNNGTVLVKAATAIDLTQGYFKFAWAPGDLVAGFNQEAEIQFIDASGKPLTSAKFLVDVRGELA